MKNLKRSNNNNNGASNPAQKARSRRIRRNIEDFAEPSDHQSESESGQKADHILGL